MINAIQKLKQEKNAVILAHNYELPEIQDIADFTGDSLNLSRQAAKTKADRIVFCGVHFMAETAKIISPDKQVLLPDATAGCPMADMISATELREFKASYPDAVTVCYINSTAEVKAESDLCCTSANAIKVIESIPADKTILFVPDKYLGGWATKKTGRNIVCWNGFCPTHARITSEIILQAKARHPEALLLVHPECRAEVCDLADKVMSTGQMIAFARESHAQDFLLCTEKGILHQLIKDNPMKRFHLVSKDFICPNMKKITLEKVYLSLKKEQFEITVNPEIAARARLSIERMLAL